jgi:hypothetical protein
MSTDNSVPRVAVTTTRDEKPHSFKRGDPLAHCGKSNSHYRSHRWTASPSLRKRIVTRGVPTASRYSFSKRACSAVPRFGTAADTANLPDR